MINFDGKKIIITGAASGIGRETAKLLDNLGAELLLIDIQAEKLEELSAELSNKHYCFLCDLIDFDEITEIIQHAKKKYQFTADGLVHCAGIPSIKPLRALSLDDYERVQKINTEAGLVLAKTFAKSGYHNKDNMCSIVFISSVYGLVGSASNVAYSISKAAVVGMTKALAVEFAKKKIRVNCIAPGFIKTNMGDSINHLFDESHEDVIEKMHLLGWGEAIDIANGIAFLLSDASKWMTGSVMSIDGGFTAQ